MVQIPRQFFARLQNDVCGTIDCAGYLLMATILGIGVLVGIATYRDQVVQEFGDIADSLESLDQSYRFTLGNQVHKFEDKNTKSHQQTEGQGPAGIQFNKAPQDEQEDKQGGQ